METPMPSLVLNPGATSPTTHRPAGRFFALSLRILLWPVRFYRARQEFAVLAGLSDHDLKDIGLSRSDLANVTALPRDVDPTIVLARTVEDRRCHRA
jgi:uncharacterized protein YjiS (DUF1127 family)